MNIDYKFGKILTNLGLFIDIEILKTLYFYNACLYIKVVKL